METSQITPERLEEIEESPRDAMIMRFEAKNLVNAYRDRIPGIRVTKRQDGVWLHFDSPSGKKACLSVEVLASNQVGIVRETLLEWADSIEVSA